ncbi:MAG: hypothetical protein MZW92_68745 [Comamonadaceae bacterium]|nr:hypothetical protein [Comamonadaceae bacterium]
MIAATNTNLGEAVKDRPIPGGPLLPAQRDPDRDPSLRERPDDVPVLAERLLAFHARNNHRSFLGFKDDALRALTVHSWPGNVRELSNAIERAAILCPTDRIGLECLPANLAPAGPRSRSATPSASTRSRNPISGGSWPTPKSLQEAAAVLGIDQATLWRRRKEYGI